MTRENKFRGQRLDNKEWVYGSLMFAPGRNGNSDYATIRVFTYHNDEGKEWVSWEDYEVDPATVGQYWIRKDENELYTGDILAVYSDCYSDIEDAKGDRASVCISTISPMGAIEIPECDFDYTHIAWLDDHCMNYEKVGNIHDNPELLKGGVQ